jgi:hypothetical protein
MGLVETMGKIGIDCELEVKVDKKRFGRIEARLLNQVERSALLNEEVVVVKIEELGILLVLDQPATLKSTHSTKRGFLALPLGTLVVI